MLMRSRVMKTVALAAAMSVLPSITRAQEIPTTISATSWEIEIDAPEQGHFWAVGPLPLDAPETLQARVEKGAVFARRLQTLGTHSAIYGIEGFGECVPEDGRLEFVEAAPEVLPGWMAHPAVADDLADLAGTADIGGHVSKAPTWTHVDGNAARQRLRCVHDCGPYLVTLWFDLFARSPVVQVVGFVARKDRRLDRDVKLALHFKEAVRFPDARLHGGRLAATGRDLTGSVDLETAGLYPLRFSLLCRTIHGRHVAPDPASRLAIRAAWRGPRWFLPTSWNSEWLGIHPAIDSPVGRRLARQGLREFLRDDGTRSFTDPRPWASAPNPNQAGAQNGLGPTWWLPALVTVRLRPHDVHLWCADDWALRPVHLFEPGTAEPIRSLPDGLTTVARQVYGPATLGKQEVPKHATKGSLPVALGSGKHDVRGAHDEQHQADAPLVAAYALTGDPLVRWLLDSHRALDLAQRRPTAGWRNGARGEGRTGFSMLLAAAVLDDEQAREAVYAHVAKRLATANRLASTADLRERAPVRPLNLMRDPRLHCQQPAYVPYEEAQFAWSCWLLWRATGSEDALHSAYRYGLVTAAGLQWDAGQNGWTVPYALWQEPTGRPLPPTRLADADLVHSSQWALWWSGCGLRALDQAADALPEAARHAPWLVNRARRALRWLDRRAPTSTDLGHHALWQTTPLR